MNCPECNKVVPITRVVKAEGDALSCVYCNQVIPSESLIWSDGKFHFNILGDVRLIQLQFGPRVLLSNQSAKVLDIPKILDRAKKIIRGEPNINCVCSEFYIQDSDIKLDLILEESEE